MRRETAANLARGWQRVIGPAIMVNLVLFGYVLFEPLLVTRISFIRRQEIMLAQAAYDLYQTDTLLFLVVFFFGIVAPGLKMIASAGAWYFLDVCHAKKIQRWIVFLGKLSMLDIMLIAIIVVAIKGVGIGSIDILPGLYVYIALVLSSFFVSLAMEHLLDRFGKAAILSRSWGDPIGRYPR
jgi:paraquat-inducible protein A